MPKILTWKNEGISIGAFMMPEQKKPVIGVMEGNTCTVYGHFTSEASADAFMTKLAELVGAIDEDEEDEEEG